MHKKILTIKNTKKMKTTIKLYIIIFLVISGILGSCNKDRDIDIITKDKITGYAQKGPFLNGTAITIMELTSVLSQTGNVYTAQILDNNGSFVFNNVELNSQYIEVRANGFYFNEIKGDNSSAQLTLYALSDISDKISVNINILSTIEKRRVEYLVAKGSTFNEAKKQGEHEILKIFEIDKPDILTSELLDISQDGDDNAILLAISVILQGYRTEAELSELLANIGADIRENGVLNNASLGSELINQVKYLNLTEVRKNIENQYEKLGINTTIPDFERYILQFINNTDFEFTNFIEYPESGEYGLNILDKNKVSYSPGAHSLAAKLPEGAKLKIKIVGPAWMYYVMQENTGWNISNEADQSKIFSSTLTGNIDLNILLHADTAQVQHGLNINVYENGVDEPTWSKIINIK